jgi:WhiB family transcriptional regulator, redox-sensing transcriptional regulator
MPPNPNNRGRGPFEEAPLVERLIAPADERWQLEAACRGSDAAFFFAPNYFERREEKDAREAKAKALCAVCPVRERCLDYALAIREPHGVWGGLNEFERRQLLRRRTLLAG